MTEQAPPVKVSIVVVSYRALRYARRMLRSVRRTVGVPYEIVVVDNDSPLPVRAWWALQSLVGRVNRLALLDQNTFFAEGCNIGVSMSARDATHVLLLNTDCEVRDPRWLARLLAVHEGGATGLRYIEGGPWPRTDGFCLLVDRDDWSVGLDEAYQWWWGATALQARLLRDGRPVRAVAEYDDLLVHHGGKSGKAHTRARSGPSDDRLVAGWFAGHHVEVLQRA